MKKEAKTLFIIIGTTRGIGAAFYAHAAAFEENEFIRINRKKVLPMPRTKDFTIDLGEDLRQSDIRKMCDAIDCARYETIAMVHIASRLAPIGRVGELAPADIALSTRVNFVSHVMFINEFLKRTVGCANEKRILIVSSGAALSPVPGLSLYCSTKAALQMFANTVSAEKGDTAVLSVDPGVVDTDMQRELRGASPKDFPDAPLYRQLKTAGKLRSPEETAARLYALFRSNGAWKRGVIKL